MDKAKIEKKIGKKIDRNLEIAIDRAITFMCDGDTSDKERKRIEEVFDEFDDQLTVMELWLLHEHTKWMGEVEKRLYKNLTPKMIQIKKNMATKNIHKNPKAYFIHTFEVRKLYWAEKRGQILAPITIDHGMLINDLVTETELMQKFAQTGKVTMEEVEKVWNSNLALEEQKVSKKKEAGPKALKR